MGRADLLHRPLFQQKERTQADVAMDLLLACLFDRFSPSESLHREARKGTRRIVCMPVARGGGQASARPVHACMHAPFAVPT
jgi:hypothetical protein